ncbi:MAG: Gfo/Idh/MocA family oxidoreductase [Planctomycetaceae bacterium]|nr:Gfo/Idh/MocA family oxidoreductase [Planctomycetaceae bacterium]
MNYLRVLDELRGFQVVAASDLSRDRLAQVKERYPLVNTVVQAGEVIDDPKIEAVVLATPAGLHFEQAVRALKAGKHVLVEKPLALEVAQCEQLVALAGSQKRTLMVDHTFLYNDAVRRMKEYVRAPDFGRVYYLCSRRNNLGPIRGDVSAIWDLAPHDISIFNHLLDEGPAEVSATTGSYLRADRADVAFLVLRYPSGVLGHIQVSWIEPSKVREVVVVGDRRRIVFDDVNIAESLRIFDRGVGVSGDVDSFGDFKYLIRDGDILSPRIVTREPLRNACTDFLESLQNAREPLSGGRIGRSVVAALHAAEESVRRNGAFVRIPS